MRSEKVRATASVGSTLARFDSRSSLLASAIRSQTSMTSHFISYFARRAEASTHSSQRSNPPALPLRTTPTPSPSPPSLRESYSGEAKEHCTFCEIVKREQAAFVVYEDEEVLAFLDILPVRPGHVLVIPKVSTKRRQGGGELIVVLRGCRSVSGIMNECEYHAGME